MKSIIKRADKVPIHAFLERIASLTLAIISPAVADSSANATFSYLID